MRPWLTGTGRRGRVRVSGRLAVVLAAAGLLVVVFFLGALRLIDAHVSQAADQRHAELRSVALIKVHQLEAWRDDRLGHSMLAGSWPITGDVAFQWMADPGDAGARAALVASLEALRVGDSTPADDDNEVVSAALIGRDGSVLLSLDPGITELRPAEILLVEAAIGAREPVLGELERDTSSAAPDVDVAVPLVDGDGTVFAALLLHLDPAVALIPIVAWWPTDSESAEALLVTRSGDRVVFISPRVGAADATLQETLSIDNEEVAAVAAVLGREGRFEGLDDRGRRVLADLRPVPGSAWYLVTKVDTAEVRLAAERDAVGTILLLGLAVLLAGAIVSLVLMVRQRGVFRRLYESERARAIETAHYDQLMAQARDIYMLVDASGRIVDANEAAAAAYGYPRAALLKLTVRDLRDPAALDDLERRWNEAASGDGVLFETVHRRSDGTTFPVEVGSRAIELDGEVYRQSLIRDITERREADAQLRRLTTAYATLAATNELIVRATDEPTLFAGICATAVQEGGYLGAWVGIPDETTGRIELVASAGSTDRFVAAIDVRLDARLAGGQGPTSTALREGRPVYLDDVETSPMSGPWQALARDYGIRASTALPLRRSGAAVAVLTLYADVPGVFTAEARRLLEEMADDISFALGSLDREVGRRQAVDALLAKDAELAEQLVELRRWYALMVGREERVLDLKAEVNDLLAVLGRPPAYGTDVQLDGERAG